MKEITKIGMDTAKSVCHIIGQDQHGNERLKRKLSRGQVHRFFANTPACVVALEACACSQYWAQQFQQYGHTVRLLPPQHVKRYLIGQKNDYNDARTILAASAQRDIHPVRIKSPDEQEKQTLDAMRRHVAMKSARPPRISAPCSRSMAWCSRREFRRSNAASSVP